MTHGKTIRIYLADANATGIRHAELVNWTGQAIVCPRGRIDELAQWAESSRPGIYVLVGSDPDEGTPLAYIGESENVRARLLTHRKNKDFWQTAVLLTSKDDNLTKSHVKYLEARLVVIAQQADRIALENGNAPQLPSLPRADRDAMEEFLEPATLLLQTLGFHLFQPVAKKTASSASVSSSRGGLIDLRLKFEIPRTGVLAQGAVTDEGFVVFAGARGPKRIGKSLKERRREHRAQLLEEGTLTVDGEMVVFAKDVLFSSPSLAGAIVSGRAIPGREAWVDSEGRTLKQLEQELADESDLEDGD
jgi:hypothetical protein